MRGNSTGLEILTLYPLCAETSLAPGLLKQWEVAHTMFVATIFLMFFPRLWDKELSSSLLLIGWTSIRSVMSLLCPQLSL
jgi:hypothetical protein